MKERPHAHGRGRWDADTTPRGEDKYHTEISERSLSDAKHTLNPPLRTITLKQQGTLWVGWVIISKFNEQHLRASSGFLGFFLFFFLIRNKSVCSRRSNTHMLVRQSYFTSRSIKEPLRNIRIHHTSHISRWSSAQLSWRCRFCFFVPLMSWAFKFIVVLGNRGWQNSLPSKSVSLFWSVSRHKPAHIHTIWSEDRRWCHP